MKIVINRKMSHPVAVFLYYLGIKPNHSTNIMGQHTIGYGKLDDCGFWQFYIARKIIK